MTERDSNVSLCTLIFVNELKRFCLIVERSHVFNLRIEENDLSGVAEVAPIVKTNRMLTTTFSIILRLPLDKDLTTFTMLLELTGNSPLKMTVSNSNSHRITFGHSVSSRNL